MAADPLYDDVIDQVSETRSVEEINRRHDISNTPSGIDIGGRGHFLENLAGEMTQRAVLIEQELYGDALFFLEDGAALVSAFEGDGRRRGRVGHTDPARVVGARQGLPGDRPILTARS